MVLVEEAEQIILAHRKDYGTETLPPDQCLGRVLAEDIVADRDLPPFDRVTMDGIAIRYEAFQRGVCTFRIKATQSAGAPPIDISDDDECIEIMTGAALPSTTDTVIPYEEINIVNGIATVKIETVAPHKNIHPRGKDKKQHELLVRAGIRITPAIINAAAAVGKTQLQVKKNPRVIILSTGDELVDIRDTPTAYQVRRSNNYGLRAVLQQEGVTADLQHLPDNPDIIERQLQQYLQEYDVILLSGGVSMGKFDYVPAALEKLQITKGFHKVRQRPGKPFWFGHRTNGTHNVSDPHHPAGPHDLCKPHHPGNAGHPTSTLIFAFPGNPVSAFLCLHRYFLPWLKATQGLSWHSPVAVLDQDFSFSPSLQYFLQVRLHIGSQGQVLATPVEGHGSGDFANLLDTDAFLELPLNREAFKKGEVYPVWVFKQVL